jgi:predicted transcriptional regulator
MNKRHFKLLLTKLEADIVFNVLNDKKNQMQLKKKEGFFSWDFSKNILYKSNRDYKTISSVIDKLLKSVNK